MPHFMVLVTVIDLFDSVSFVLLFSKSLIFLTLPFLSCFSLKLILKKWTSGWNIHESSLNHSPLKQNLHLQSVCVAFAIGCVAYKSLVAESI